ncbi:MULTISPECIES: hypothetical protein, partial [unclassified Dehalobacter]|uniref:hypothetical protein n=1 Tax=unclassified Dehalobacter TaxID=2635733 RepID=UPI001A9A4676
YNLNRLFLTGTIPVIPSILTDSMKPHYIYSVKGCIYFDRSPKNLSPVIFRIFLLFAAKIQQYI